jgi:hypothetical protein
VINLIEFRAFRQGCRRWLGGRPGRLRGPSLEEQAEVTECVLGRRLRQRCPRECKVLGSKVFQALSAGDRP